MEKKELNRILSTKAPAGERLLIELPQNISCQHSSATDYLDAVVSYGSQMMKSVDNLMVSFRLGAVHKKLSGCRGAIMPRINCQGKIMDGSVLYFDVQSGKILYGEILLSGKSFTGQKNKAETLLQDFSLFGYFACCKKTLVT